MTLAYWCVLIAGLMPFFVAAPAKSNRGYDNSAPRLWAAQQTGFAGRALAAHQNCFEAFPLFAAAVIIAHQFAAAQATLDLLAMVYITARLAYVAAYYADKGTLRSIVWGVALLTAIAIFTLPAWG